MPALFGNLNIGEIILIGIIAVVVFGKELPRVVVEVAGHLQRAKRALSDLRRETGIDRELRQVDFTVRRAAREAQDALERRALKEPAPPPRAVAHVEPVEPTAPAEPAERAAPAQPDESVAREP